MAAATVLQWVRRLARTAACGAKGVLALVAVAAVIAWPWSYLHPYVTEGQRVTVSDRSVEREWIVRGWADGRIGIATGSRGVMSEPEDPIRKQLGVPGVGPAWRWQRLRSDQLWAALRAPPSWAPVRWTTMHQEPVGGFDGPRVYGFDRTAMVSLWFVALVTGAWPVTSSLLWLRRRRRFRRAALVGHCPRCGYDVRATPAATGPRLPTCPECGAKAG